MSYHLSYTSLITPGVSKALAKVSSATPGSQWTGQAQARGQGQGQGQGREETWINVEQKQMQVQRAPLHYSTFVNQPARDIGMEIDPFDTATPIPDPAPVQAFSQVQFPVPVYGSEPRSRPRQDLIKVHDSGVVLQLSEVSSEPAQSQKGQGKDIPDDWEVVYPDE